MLKWMMDPEFQQVILAFLGAVAGWLAKSRAAAPSAEQQETLDLLASIRRERRQAETRALLAEAIAATSPAQRPSPPPQA
jgi:hypothetical protein